MHTTNYVNTLIEFSEDCPAETGTVPPKSGTVAELQYRFLSEDPYRFTSDQLLAAVTATRQKRREAEWPDVMAELLAKPQACLRSSPLVKTYGWCLHHDGKGRVALVAPQSEDHLRLRADPGVVKTRGMRSKRS